jgi:hypothetical protein
MLMLLDEPTVFGLGLGTTIYEQGVQGVCLALFFVLLWLLGFVWAAIFNRIL